MKRLVHMRCLSASALEAFWLGKSEAFSLLLLVIDFRKIGLWRLRGVKMRGRCFECGFMGEVLSPDFEMHENNARIW